MTKPQNPNQPPEQPGAGRPPQKPAGLPLQKAPLSPRPGTPPARGPLAARQQPAQPQRQPVALPVKPVNGTPQQIVAYLGGQIQVLATRLEALREQGAGNTTEFRQLEQMLGVVQDKLMLAQSRITRGS
ncbi:MAG: hypothetical protein JWM80_2630 [Cyanobacteria bacterium RYN_339]|nr:hypothetical protein [Cyanobacteria bacterium RYN_339]